MIHGILLSAGRGRRVGVPKALLEWNGATFHQRGLEAIRGAGLAVVAVVNTRVEEALPVPDGDERRAMNPDPDQGGMLGSVRLGLALAREGGATGAILLPVDHPKVTSDDVRRVAGALLEGALIAVPVHGGRRGHPIGISRVVMEEIAADPTLPSLRSVVRRDPARVVEVAAGAGILEGVNTPEDLERVTARSFR